MLGTALVAGLLPALQATRMDLASAMKEGGLQMGVRRGRLRSAFVVAQVALSVVLLAVAGLFARSLQRTVSVDPGLRAAGVAHVRLNLAPHGYDEPRARALLARLSAGLAVRPEIAAAAYAANAPLSGSTSMSDATRADRAGADTVENVQWTVAGVGLPELLGVRLLAGRTFTAADDSAAPPVVVINETLARRFWPATSLRDVLGGRLSVNGVEPTVVGVVAHGKYTLLQEDPRPFGFVPFGQDFRVNPMLYLRGRGTPEDAVRAAREELAALDPNVALERPTRLSADVARYLVPQRVGAFLVGTFGAVALFLVMTGLYGVLAYGVAQRLREFGVRVALGARASDVVRLVVRNGLTVVGAGVALGLVAAFGAGRLIAGFLFGLSPTDPLTLAAVPLLLLLVALLASALPARRAAAADPMASLRAE
jgi:predicted permease